MFKKIQKVGESQNLLESKIIRLLFKWAKKYIKI